MVESEPTDEDDQAYLLEDLQNRCKPYAPRAKKIGTVIRSLLVRRGLQDEQAAMLTQEQWAIAVGPQIAAHTRCGNISRNVLLISVDNNLVMQELHFSKLRILESLKRTLPQLKIRDLKFRIRA